MYRGRVTMPREKGSKNFTLREDRLKARIDALKIEKKAQIEKYKGKLKVKDARIRELKAKLKGE
jgi:hypothetical protein